MGNMSTPKTKSPSPKRKPLRPSERLRGLKDSYTQGEMEKIRPNMLPPLKPPVTWTSGISLPADEDGRAKYRVGLKGNPLPEVYPSKAPSVPDALFRDLVARGLSSGQIAREMEISPDAVRRRLIRLNLKTDHQKALEDYKTRKADILSSHQMDILSGITPEKIQASGIDSLTRSFSTLYDRERVERGLSTEIIDINQGMSRVSQIEELQRRVLLRLGISKEVGNSEMDTIVVGAEVSAGG
jgi:predicted transcriptional regulator